MKIQVVLSRYVHFYYIKSTFFDISSKFSRVMIVERQTIPHLNALVGGTKILEEQLWSSFRGCHATAPLNSVFFTRKVAWQSLIEVHSWAWDILTPTSRAKKWGIICSCSSSGSHSNCLQSKKWKWAYHQLR